MSVTQSSRARRSAGLDQLRSITTWVAMGGAAAVGFFTLSLAHALPGRSSAAAGTGATSSGTSSGAPSSASQSTSSGAGLQGPPQAPVASQQAPVVVSGGS